MSAAGRVAAVCRGGRCDGPGRAAASTLYSTVTLMVTVPSLLTVGLSQYTE
jgi:hypothetical protein